MMNDDDEGITKKNIPKDEFDVKDIIDKLISSVLILEKMSFSV